MDRDHDDYICKALLADEALHSKVRIWLDILLIIPFAVAYTLQYRHSLKASNKQLPRSYVVCAALFALFQLCDYLLDDAYGVLVEAHCSEWYSNAKATFDVWKMSWVLGYQCLMATGLMGVYTVRNWREVPAEEENHRHNEARQEPDEETPSLHPPSPQPTHRLRQTSSRADLDANLDWSAIPAPVLYCIVTIIVLLATINLFLFALVLSSGAGTALFLTCLLVLVLFLLLGCFPLGKKQRSHRGHSQESRSEPSEETMGETEPLLPTAATAVSDARQPGYRISGINSYADWSITINLSSLRAWLTIGIIAFLLMFYVLKPLYDADHNLLLTVVLLLCMLFLVVLAFLPEARNKEVERRWNLLCAGLLTIIVLVVLNIYTGAMWWDPSRWGDPVDSDLLVLIFRSASLVFSWLFFILQFLPLIRRVWKRQDTGLGLWFLVIIITAQVLMLASLVERAEKRFQIDRLWCLDEDASHSCGEPFYEVARREHVWEVPLFWVLSMQARMSYAIAMSVVAVVCAWWRGRKQSEEMRGEEDNGEERAVLE